MAVLNTDIISGIWASLIEMSFQN